jgi:hypothetical protein
LSRTYNTLMVSQEIKDLISSTEEILEPETIRQLHPDMSEERVNRVLAFAVLHKTRAFWENMYAFEDMVQALNGLVPVPNVLQSCTPEQLWYALEVVHELYPDREYAHEVLLYIQAMFDDAGVYIYPTYLPIDNPYFSRAVYLSEHGPFPLGETTEEIQAVKYLILKDYLGRMKQTQEL